MAKKTQGLLKFGRMLACILLALSVYFLIDGISSYPDLPIEELLIPDPEFPSRWNVGSQIVIVDWEVSRESFCLKNDKDYHSQSNLGRFWTNGGDRISTPEILFNLSKSFLRSSTLLKGGLSFMY